MSNPYGPSGPPGQGYGGDQPPYRGSYGQPGQPPQQPGSYGQPTPPPAYGQQPGGYGQPAPPTSYGQPTPPPAYGQQPGGYGQPPQGPYGQQPGFTAPPAKKGNGKIIGIIVGVLVAVALLVAALLYFTRSTVFDQAAVQNGVKSVLTDQYRVADVGTVSCPADQEVRSGATFTCTASIGGQDQTIAITVTDDNGTYTVARP